MGFYPLSGEKCFFVLICRSKADTDALWQVFCLSPLQFSPRLSCVCECVHSSRRTFVRSAVWDLREGLALNLCWSFSQGSVLVPPPNFIHAWLCGLCWNIKGLFFLSKLFPHTMQMWVLHQPCVISTDEINTAHNISSYREHRDKVLEYNFPIKLRLQGWENVTF